VTAASASKDDARLLGVTRGDPMLVERRVILDGHGRPVEATESRYPADRYAIDVRFDVEEARPGTVTPSSEVAAAR
jgi:GntR family transcriptional regulator